MPNRWYRTIRVVFAIMSCHAGNKQGLGEQPSLIAAMQRIVPESQVSAVLPLLVKLSYLEAQLGEGSSNAQTQDKEALVGGWDYCL